MSQLDRYKFLCEAFNRAYNVDATDDDNIVSASLILASRGWRTVQFTINIQERQETPVDLDGFIKAYMENNQ